MGKISYGQGKKNVCYIINLLNSMNDLESIVKQLYGKRIVKSKAQGNPHFLFNVYEDQQTH